MPFCSEVDDGLLFPLPGNCGPASLMFKVCILPMSAPSDSYREATRGIGGSIGGFAATGDGVFPSGCRPGGGRRGGSEGGKALS